VVDFIFTIIDKDKSGTLDAEELGDVARKVFGLALDVLEAALKCVANSAHEAATKVSPALNPRILTMTRLPTLDSDVLYITFGRE
jgi:hypothetical protein